MINFQLELKFKVQPLTFLKVKCFMTFDTLDDAFICDVVFFFTLVSAFTMSLNSLRSHYFIHEHTFVNLSTFANRFRCMMVTLLLFHFQAKTR